MEIQCASLICYEICHPGPARQNAATHSATHTHHSQQPLRSASLSLPPCHPPAPLSQPSRTRARQHIPASPTRHCTSPHLPFQLTSDARWTGTDHQEHGAETRHERRTMESPIDRIFDEVRLARTPSTHHHLLLRVCATTMRVEAPATRTTGTAPTGKASERWMWMRRSMSSYQEATGKAMAGTRERGKGMATGMTARTVMSQGRGNLRISPASVNGRTATRYSTTKLRSSNTLPAVSTCVRPGVLPLPFPWVSAFRVRYLQHGASG